MRRLQSGNTRLYGGMGRPEIAFIHNGRAGGRRFLQSVDCRLRSDCGRSNSICSELGGAAVGETQEMCDCLRAKAYQHEREGCGAVIAIRTYRSQLACRERGPQHKCHPDQLKLF